MSNISPLDTYRESAQKIFDDKGMPTSKVEAYKYSSIKDLIDDTEIFYNDLRPEGELQQKGNGVIVGSLLTFAHKHPDIFERYYNIIAGRSEDSLVALNTTLASGGSVVYVPEEVMIEKPIVVDVTEDVNDFGRRDLFIFDTNSEARIIVRHNGISDILNRVCEVVVMSGAKVEITEDNSGSNNSRKINTILVDQFANSSFKHTLIVAQQGFCRNNIAVSLQGKGAECELYGITISKGNSHLDNSTTIEHISENCVSRQLYKNVVNDSSTAIFNGNIFVAEGAQKTEAYQKNNNILLSPEATVHTKPQLVINADDVKCSHGATVGQLNDEALFYIRQRGISEEQAQGLLLTGFVGEVLQHIKDEELREELTEKLYV